MTNLWTYHIDIEGGLTDTSLTAIRLRAMGHLTSTNTSELTVYATSTKKIRVGTVIRDPQSKHRFYWVSEGKRMTDRRPIHSDGAIYRHARP